MLVWLSTYLSPCLTACLPNCIPLPVCVSALLFVSLPICPYHYLSPSLSVYRLTCPPGFLSLSLCLSVCLPAYLTVYFFVYLPFCLSSYMFTYRTVCLTICLCLIAFMSVCLLALMFCLLCLLTYLSIYPPSICVPEFHTLIKPTHSVSSSILSFLVTLPLSLCPPTHSHHPIEPNPCIKIHHPYEIDTKLLLFCIYRYL